MKFIAHFLLYSIMKNIGAMAKDLLFFWFYVVSLITSNRVFFNSNVFFVREMVRVCVLFFPISLYIQCLLWSIWIFSPMQLITVHIITLLFYDSFAQYWRNSVLWLAKNFIAQKTQTTKP